MIVKKTFIIMGISLCSFVLTGQIYGLQSKFPSSGTSRNINQELIDQIQRKKSLEKQVAEINKSFAPPQKYKDKYPKFLKSDKAGLLRLISDQNCNDGQVVNVEDIERCSNLPPIKGAGSRYSFRLTDLPDYLSFEDVLFYIGEADFQYTNGKFVVGKGLTQGIITNIGQRDLEEINSESEIVKILSDWKPVKNEFGLNEQKTILEKGVKVGNYLLSNTAKVEQNNAYLIRCTAYGSGKFRSFWNTDILVALRVVGEESDGSIIIIWKRLSKKDAPFLKS
jgi:hypothetical protein